MRLLPLVSLIGIGCGGVSAEAPLTVKLGATRDQTITTLKSHKYCPKAGMPAARMETYPRCDRPGTEWGESWVTARYENDRLVEVRRYERFTDENRAVERWNQLVDDRAKISTESPEATKALSSRLLEPGTRTVKAFRADADTVVGVYLLNPTPPEEASVLEALILVPAESAKLGAATGRELDDGDLRPFDMPSKRELDAKILRVISTPATTPAPSVIEQQLRRAMEQEQTQRERPIGDFPSACGYGRCERSQPFGFPE